MAASLFRVPREPWVKKAKAVLRDPDLREQYAIVRYDGEDEEGEACAASEGEQAVEEAERGTPGVYQVVDSGTGEVIRTCRINSVGGRVLGQGRLTPRDDLARREQRLVEGHERYNLLVREDLRQAREEVSELRKALDAEKDARRELQTKLALAENEDGMGGWAAIADKVFTLFATDKAQEKLLMRFQVLMRKLSSEEQDFAERLFNEAMAISEDEVEAEAAKQEARAKAH